MFWTLFTANILVKGFIVLGVATLMTLALRRASAAARHAVWALALLSLLALPFLSSVLPSWRMPVPAMWLPVTPSLDAPLERMRLPLSWPLDPKPRQRPLLKRQLLRPRAYFHRVLSRSRHRFRAP